MPFGVAEVVSPRGGTAFLGHQAFGRADGDTEAWQRLQWQLAKGGHLRVIAKLVKDEDPSAAVTGSILLLVAERRCFLYLLMCICGAGTGSRGAGTRTHLNKALSNLI